MMLKWVFVDVAVMFVGVAVMVMGGAVSEGGPQSLLKKDGSFWQQVFSPNTSLRTNNKDGHTYNHVTDSHNYNTSLHNQGSFYSIINQNGNIHKLLKTNIGTGVMDKVIQYVFDKMGTRRSRSFGTAYLGNHDNHQPSTNRHNNNNREAYMKDYGSDFSSYSYDNEYVKKPNNGLCVETQSHYLRSDGPMCFDVYTAISIAALAILLQFLLQFTFAAFCPTSRTRTLVFNITNDNFINVGSKGGNQSQDQNQDQYEYQDQYQFQYEFQDQEEFQQQQQFQAEFQSQSENQNQNQNQDVNIEDDRHLFRQNSVTNEDNELSKQKKIDLNNDGGEVWPKNSSLTKSKDILHRLESLDQTKFKKMKVDKRSVSQKSEIVTNMEEWSQLPIWQKMARKVEESGSFPLNLKSLFMTLENWRNFNFNLGDWPNFNIFGNWNDENLSSVTHPKDYICSVFNTFLKG